MTILVLGGTGNVGRHLVDRLVKMGQAVRVLVRNADRALLVPQGAEAFVADIVGNPGTARGAFAGIDIVFMLNAATVHETIEGLTAVAMAQAANVRRFVYQSSHSLDHLYRVPHLGAKFVIEEAVKASGMSYTIIRPNYFFQNDEFARYGLMNQGVYLNSIGDIGCWSVDVRDIAEAVARVLSEDGHDGRNYALVGPEKLTGPQCAAIWSQALGRPLDHEGRISQFQAVAQPYLPPWLVESLGMMLEEIARHGMLGTAGEVDALTALLGRPPRRYAEYVAETAAQWQQA